MTTKTYSTKSNATSAARKSLGKEAKAGEHFTVAPHEGRWTFTVAHKSPARGTRAASGTRRDVGGQPKMKQLLGLVGRKDGALGTELEDALGWLPHTVRSAISVLNKHGHKVELVGSRPSRYKLAA